MCEELAPSDPEVQCDMSWTHRFIHGNTSSGLFWETPRPPSEASMRKAKMAQIKRAIQSSSD